MLSSFSLDDLIVNPRQAYEAGAPDHLLKLTMADLIERERDSGVDFGPFHRRWLIERAPEKVREYLRLAALHPQLVATRQGITAMDNTDFPPASFTAVTASATETNLWTPATWSSIGALDMKSGKGYVAKFGGIFTSTATQGLLTFTPRVGQSGTPASNVSLGASNTTAPPASLTNQAWYGQFDWGLRGVGLAASGATAAGGGFVVVQGAAAATGILYVMGGTVPTTVDSTAASGTIVSITISVASQSYQCQWVKHKSDN